MDQVHGSVVHESTDFIKQQASKTESMAQILYREGVRGF
jgi:hypothetical protein